MEMYDFQIISPIQHCPCSYLVPSGNKLFFEPVVTQIHTGQISLDISEPHWLSAGLPEIFKGNLTGVQTCDAYRLFHGPSLTMSSGCHMFLRTAHSPRNLYENPYSIGNRKEEETDP